MATPQTGPASRGNGEVTAAGQPQPQQQQQEVLASVLSLLPILDGFNHRNQNQHHSARWWSSFAMLRRHAAKLAAELNDGAAAAPAATKKQQKKKKQTAAAAAAEVRARWLVDVLIPKCYFAFSQLTADNQFAPLGVALLGALAQANSACRLLVGEPAADAAGGDGEDQAETVAGAEQRRHPGLPPAAARLVGDGDVRMEDADLGQVVSREEFQKVGPAPAGVSKADRPLKRAKGEPEAADGEREKAKSTKKKKKKAKGDEFDDLFKTLV